ncbi:tetratricopeptide [Colletotrichum musicola]|uniref:Tetratricopeptide n=1 Tax=Colletotrichum musicola TaxID=2175873 RepID=A0A8H6IW29_9PEZI|nr:tetratricopeptide [Colletotrichum musicola]
MASTGAVPKSAAARERGNDLYRKGKFAEAYQEAAALAPEDPAPWSNISAIKFEQGNYASALKNLEKALSLSSSEPDDGPKKQKLLTRMAKCHLHSLCLKDAEQAVKNLADDASGKELRAALGGLQKTWSASPDGGAFGKQVQDKPEYYPMGHDQGDSLFDPKVRADLRSNRDISFLFCGSGDARHLFVTLSTMGFAELMARKDGKQNFFDRAHFTLVDINAAAIARTLIMLDMVMQYCLVKSQQLPRIEDALTVMAYVYTSAFIPPFVAMKLQEHIKALIFHLEDGNEVFCFLYVPEETRAQVVYKLKQWSQPLGDNYAPKKIRPAVLKKFNRAEQQRKMAFGGDSDKTQTEQAHRDFRDFGAVFANDVFIGRREPELPALLADFRAGRPGAKEKLENPIDTKWQTNPTVLDMDYEPRRANIIPPGEPVDLTPSIEWDPMALVKAVAPPSEKSPTADGLASLGRFFEHLALSNMVLADRVDFELIIGEMAGVLERVQHDSLPRRALKPEEKDGLAPTRFPRQYDRIHMSNIPDYVRPAYGADTHEHFLSEYVLMHDAAQLKDHFRLVREKDPHAAAVPESFTRMMGVTPFMTENYFIWGRSPGARRASKLMSRPALEHWLHAHLLKIVLPHRRPLGGDRPVLTPLNLTAFLRLVGMLHGVGYPAHWLSGILASVCSGSITTTARPPRELVLSPESVSTTYPSRKVSLGPWKAEFTTLLSLWQRLLPFGVVAPVPSPEEVRECSVTFDEVFGWHGRVPHVG